jgi:hypothetical protein
LMMMTQKIVPLMLPESMQPGLLESAECDHIFSKFETFPVAFNVCLLAYFTAQKEMHVLMSKLSQFLRYEVVSSYIRIKLISLASILLVVCVFTRPGDTLCV